MDFMQVTITVTGRGGDSTKLDVHAKSTPPMPTEEEYNELSYTDKGIVTLVANMLDRAMSVTDDLHIGE